eukprot:m.291975 g.291975  ORF g.291975 m.291975 type:complete len:64 (-) comp12541_c0_seq1:26-217(-)
MSLFSPFSFLFSPTVENRGQEEGLVALALRCSSGHQTSPLERAFCCCVSAILFCPVSLAQVST